MEPISFVPPREVHLDKPVRIVLLGGFLGAGKTTALSTLAKRLQQKNLAVGAVTNDQAVNLVDTAIVQSSGVPVAEVAGGCFCCRFTDLIDAAQTVLAHQPDILLCEPVGSCTDMAATVLQPMRRFYGDQFQFAPFTVLVDPQRAAEHLQDEGNGSFPAEVDYIFGKQLEEADIIALNKTDTLEAKEADRLIMALESRYGKPVIQVSAATGEGFEAWISLLLGNGEAGSHVLRELDYDLYARGEAVLGWLNAAAQIDGGPEFDADRLAADVMEAIRAACQREQAEIAHLKILLTSGDRSRRMHVTTTAAPPAYSGSPLGTVTSAMLTVNARVHIAPGTLGGIAVTAIQQAAHNAGATGQITALQSFSPAYPRPPYRMATAA